MSAITSASYKSHRVPDQLVGEDCPICKESFSDNDIIVSHGGLHHLCKKCAEIWLTRASRCPICNCRIDGRIDSFMPILHNKQVQKIIFCLVFLGIFLYNLCNE